MRRRFIMVLVVASLVGLLVSLVLYRSLTALSAGSPGEPSEKIVAAAVNMSMAETVTAQHVRLVPWPKDSVPEGALRSVAAAEARVVRSSIAAGEPLMERKLAPQLAGRGGLMPMLVGEGLRGVTIKVDEATRESGFILPNSRVDVLVSMAKDRASQERVAKVILQRVLVLAAGQTVELRDNKPVTVTTVTLALTPQEAERLALAQTEGRLMLATRNLRDDQIVETPGVTASSLLGDAAAPARPAPKPAPLVAKTSHKTSQPAEPAPAPPYVVSVQRGGAVTEYRFVRRGGDVWDEVQKQK